MIVYSFVIVLIGIGIDLIAYFVHLKTGLKLREGMPMTALFFGIWFMGLYFKFQLTGIASTKGISNDLRTRFDELCNHLNLSGLKLLAASRSRVTGSILKDEIFITEQALRELSLPALEFILGHELAHRKYIIAKPVSQGKKPYWLVATVLSGALIPFISLRLELPWTYYIPTVLPFVAVMVYVAWKYPTAASSACPEMELACDYVALQIMEDPGSSIDCLKSLSYGSKLDRKIFGYPSKEERLDQAERFLSGEPRTTYKNKFVEEGIQRILADLEASKLAETQ